MIEQQDTPIERLGTAVKFQDEIERLRKWMELVKIHTLDGSVLALIDMALEGKKPLPGDYTPDGCVETDEMQTLRWEAEIQDTEPTIHSKV